MDNVTRLEIKEIHTKSTKRIITFGADGAHNGSKGIKMYKGFVLVVLGYTNLSYCEYIYVLYNCYLIKF